MTAFWIAIACIVGVGFAVGGLLAVVRMIIGPTIVDRMAASDTLLTILICVLGAEMIINRHTTMLPLMLALAMTAFIASVTVARYVSRQEKVAAEEASGEIVTDTVEPVDTISALERAEEAETRDDAGPTRDGGGR